VVPKLSNQRGAGPRVADALIQRDDAAIGPLRDGAGADPAFGAGAGDGIATALAYAGDAAALRAMFADRTVADPCSPLPAA